MERSDDADSTLTFNTKGVIGGTVSSEEMFEENSKKGEGGWKKGVGRGMCAVSWAQSVFFSRVERALSLPTLATTPKDPKDDYPLNSPNLPYPPHEPRRDAVFSLLGRRPNSVSVMRKVY